jgi:hypothetical protein
VYLNRRYRRNIIKHEARWERVGLKEQLVKPEDTVEIEFLNEYTSVRLTCPGRIWLTPAQARAEGMPTNIVQEAVYEVLQRISRQYGFQFSLPRQRQSEEYGVLWHEPRLAKQVLEQGVVPISEGIHADDSHKLANEGIVHIDCDDPVVAADLANPVAAWAENLKESRRFFNETNRVLEETTVLLEERIVRAGDQIAEQNQAALDVTVQQMINTYQERMEGFFGNQEREWNRQRTAFFRNQRDQFQQVVRQFRERFGVMWEERAAGQMLIEDWIEIEGEDGD